MRQVAKEYLHEIEMRNTQYVVVKHADKEHLHMHIVANRIDNDGQIIGKGFIVERGIKAAERLTEKHHLQQEKGKNLDLTNMEALHEPDAKRYKLYQAIRRHLPGCRLEDLEKRLLAEGITVRYRQDPVSGQRQGISFGIENYKFAGPPGQESSSGEDLFVNRTCNCKSVLFSTGIYLFEDRRLRF
jgi:hypothetical protein